ncbi:uncharacterized protein LOC131288892 [Anopheles ziemanni]|uniref:uncharacterized protein LOC131259919 n=1 Tax=Anopheles coustani TaxID=139045 RepID=UPI00265ACB28|nr:uncharacterized protein LOC131259919 [Anopheles coustani]XP_058174055.1 uncharacterized protein LOC131288892 [Anopheles ziemanni]
MAVLSATWIVLLGILNVCTGMSIPEDMEILNGYEFGSSNTELASEDDGFSERRSLLEPFYHRAIRDKREAHYRVLESPGFYSHFRSEDANIMDNTLKKRIRRDLPANKNSVSIMQQGQTNTGTEIALAEKQIMNNREHIIPEQWVKPDKLSGFPGKIINRQADSDADASSIINKGLNSRAPRVNFITQQTKSPELSTETQSDGSGKVIRELHRRPMQTTYYLSPAKRDYDSYMAPSQSPMFPRVYDKYDAFHRDMMDRLHPPSPHRYDQYYQRRYDVDYDSYYPRYKFPYFYYYPDKRFDIPLYYRNRNYIYTNDVTDLGSPVSPNYEASLKPLSILSAGPVLRNRRIIYYATLPEIVRTPVNLPVDYRVNKYNRNRFESLHSTQVPPLPNAHNELRVNAHGRKEDKYVSSNPIKIVRQVGFSHHRSKENPTAQEQSSLYEKSFTDQQRKWSSFGG